MAAAHHARRRRKGHVTQLPWSARVCDGLVLGLAGWTLLCNVVVYFHGSFRDILRAGLTAAALAGLYLAYRARSCSSSPRPRSSDSQRNGPDLPVPPSLGLDTRNGLFGVLGALALCAAYVWTNAIVVLWWLTLVYLVIALSLVMREVPSREAPVPRSALREAVVWFTALCGGAVPLFLHNWSADDAYYLNVVVSAVDSPDAPVLQLDTLHGIAGLPIMLSVYKVVSHELLAAAVSYLTGLSAIQAYHLVLPAVFGLFLVLASARLIRWLTPGYWIWTFVAVMGLVFSVGAKARHFGALLRLQHGKTVFFAVLIPLLMVYGLQFARRPNLRNWLRLGAAQVAGIGLTSTALWAGPAVGALALLSGIRISKKGLQTFAWGLAASAYVVAVALALRSSIESQFQVEPVSSAMTIGGAWYRTIGGGPVSAVCLFATLGAWCFFRNSLARRLAVVFPLATLVLLLNPYTAPFVASHVTGALTYWRVLWILPIPVLLGVIMTAPFAVDRLRIPRAGKAAMSTAFVATFVLFAPDYYLFQQTQHTLPLRLFGLKVPAHYEVAERIANNVPARSLILAPTAITAWVATVHDYPYVVMSRPEYMVFQRSRIEAEEFDLRVKLTGYVSGSSRPPNAARLLDSGIQQLDLKAVCFQLEPMGWAQEIRDRLQGNGFRRLDVFSNYETWVR